MINHQKKPLDDDIKEPSWFIGSLGVFFVCYDATTCQGVADFSTKNLTDQNSRTLQSFEHSNIDILW